MLAQPCLYLLSPFWYAYTTQINLIFLDYDWVELRNAKRYNVNIDDYKHGFLRTLTFFIWHKCKFSNVDYCLKIRSVPMFKGGKILFEIRNYIIKMKTFKSDQTFDAIF